MADFVEVTGHEHLRRAFDRANAKVSAQRLSKELSRIATPIARAMRSEAPVDEDRSASATVPLKKAIKKSARRGSGRSSTLAQVDVGVLRPARRTRLKALAQEFGTKRHDPQSYMIPVFDAHRNRVVAEITAFVREAFRRA